MGEVSITLIKEIGKCQKCATIDGHIKFPITSRGTLKGKYLLISDAPVKDDLNKKKYWVSDGGQILRACSLAANTSLEELFYLTDMVKCWPCESGKNRKPFEFEAANCFCFLEREILELKPKLVVCIGKIASSFLLKRPVSIKEEHGNIYSYNKDTNILLLLHPRGIDRHMDKSQYKKQLVILFKKLREGKDEEAEDIFYARHDKNKAFVI
jgi:uracil-DNA glycosylase